MVNGAKQDTDWIIRVSWKTRYIIYDKKDYIKRGVEMEERKMEIIISLKPDMKFQIIPLSLKSL